LEVDIAAVTACRYIAVVCRLDSLALAGSLRLLQTQKQTQI